MFIINKSNQTLLRAKCSQKKMQKSKAYNHIQYIHTREFKNILRNSATPRPKSLHNKIILKDKRKQFLKSVNNSRMSRKE